MLNSTMLTTSRLLLTMEYFSLIQHIICGQKINGLSGAALTVKEITGLGSGNFIATHGGLFRSSDLGDNWIPMVPNHKFNTVSIVPSALSPFGWVVFAFGVNGYYSLDFTNFVSIDLTGITGEITCLASSEG